MGCHNSKITPINSQIKNIEKFSFISIKPDKKSTEERKLEQEEEMTEKEIAKYTEREIVRQKFRRDFLPLEERTVVLEL
tara:strand:- start:2871 stop:3107 length:237 start_codon:yes stop_codon:yes gene_type:complete